MAGTGHPARQTFPFISEVPGGPLIPVSAYEEGAAPVAIGAASGLVVNISGIRVAHAIGQGDLPGQKKRLSGCRRPVQEPPVGVKCSEMHGHIRTQFRHHPAGHGVDLFVGVVLARDQQGGDLEPDLGLVPEVDQGFQYRLKLAAAQSLLEARR